MGKKLKIISCIQNFFQNILHDQWTCKNGSCQSREVGYGKVVCHNFHKYLHGGANFLVFFQLFRFHRKFFSSFSKLQNTNLTTFPIVFFFQSHVPKKFHPGIWASIQNFNQREKNHQNIWITRLAFLLRKVIMLHLNFAFMNLPQNIRDSTTRFEFQNK